MTTTPTTPADLTELAEGIRELSRTVAVLVEKVDRIDSKLDNLTDLKGEKRP